MYLLVGHVWEANCIYIFYLCHRTNCEANSSTDSNIFFLIATVDIVIIGIFDDLWVSLVFWIELLECSPRSTFCLWNSRSLYYSEFLDVYLGCNKFWVLENCVANRYCNCPCFSWSNKFHYFVWCRWI